MSRLLGVIVAAVLVGLLFAALTSVVPLTGLEGLVLLSVLVSVTVLVARLRRRRLAHH